MPKNSVRFAVHVFSLTLVSLAAVHNCWSPSNGKLAQSVWEFEKIKEIRNRVSKLLTVTLNCAAKYGRGLMEFSAGYTASIAEHVSVPNLAKHLLSNLSRAFLPPPFPPLLVEL